MSWLSGAAMAAALLLGLGMPAQAGPELPSGSDRGKGEVASAPVKESASPERPRFQLPRLVHPGNYQTRRRPIGWGSSLNPFRGPTYYYPSTHDYRGSNPTYYPFFQERLWPNYKSEPPKREAGWFSFLRKDKPAPTVDDYDRFQRDGRYGERQWNR
jgi:hypothetical protein